MACAFDPQPTTGLAYWGDVVKEGLASSSTKKKLDKPFFFFLMFTPGNPICNHSNQVLLRFG